jgi:hypothetical protein
MYASRKCQWCDEDRDVSVHSGDSDDREAHEWVCTHCRRSWREHARNVVGRTICEPAPVWQEYVLPVAP